MSAVVPGAGVTNAHAEKASQQTHCQFFFGFAELRQLIGDEVVGDCLEDQYSVANGDARQQTTGGLLAWIKADNRTIFTDGFRTWAAGPDGAQVSLNQDSASDGASVAPAPPPAPSPSPSLPAPVLPTSAWTLASTNFPQISGLGPSPEYPSDNRIFRVNSQVVQVSTTQGRTWEQAGTRSSCPRPPISAYSFSSLLLSPTFATDNTLLAFASPAWGPLSISTDGGQTWNCLPQRFTQAYRNAAAVFSPSFAQDHRLWVRGTADGSPRSYMSGPRVQVMEARRWTGCDDFVRTPLFAVT